MKQLDNTLKFSQSFYKCNVTELQSLVAQLDKVEQTKILETLNENFWKAIDKYHKKYAKEKIVLAQMAANCCKTGIFIKMLRKFSFASQLMIIENNTTFIKSLKIHKQLIIELLQFAVAINHYALFVKICDIHNENIYIISNSPFTIKYLCSRQKSAEEIINALHQLQSRPRNLVIKDARLDELSEDQHYNDLIKNYPLSSEITHFNDLAKIRSSGSKIADMLKTYGVSLLTFNNYQGLKFSLDFKNYDIAKAILKVLFNNNNLAVSNDTNKILINYLIEKEYIYTLSFLLRFIDKHKLEEIANSLATTPEKKLLILLYLEQYKTIESLDFIVNMKLGNITENILFEASRLGFTRYITHVYDYYKPSNEETTKVIDALIKISGQEDNYRAIAFLSTKLETLKAEEIWNIFGHQKILTNSLFRYIYSEMNEATDTYSEMGAAINTWMTNSRLNNYHKATTAISAIAHYWHCKEFSKVERIFQHPFLAGHYNEALNKLLSIDLSSNIAFAIELASRYSFAQNKMGNIANIIHKIPTRWNVSTYEEAIHNILPEEFYNSFNLFTIINYKPAVIIKSFTAIKAYVQLDTICTHSIVNPTHENKDFAIPQVAIFLQTHASSLLSVRNYTMAQLEAIKECVELQFLLNRITTSKDPLDLYAYALQTLIPYNSFNASISNTALSFIQYNLLESSVKIDKAEDWIFKIGEVASSWCHFLYKMNGYCEYKEKSKLL